MRKTREGLSIRSRRMCGALFLMLVLSKQDGFVLIFKIEKYSEILETPFSVKLCT